MNLLCILTTWVAMNTYGDPLHQSFLYQQCPPGVIMFDLNTFPPWARLDLGLDQCGNTTRSTLT